VDESLAEFAYLDRPLPIEAGQTISQPYTVAFQTELLQLKPGEKVLEIGTGSGYQAAVLCEMGAEVYSIERNYELYLSAKERLNRLGYSPHLFSVMAMKVCPTTLLSTRFWLRLHRKKCRRS